MQLNFLSAVFFVVSASALEYARPAQSNKQAEAAPAVEVATPAVEAAAPAVEATPAKKPAAKKVPAKNYAPANQTPRVFASGIITDYGNSEDAFSINDIILTPSVPVAGQPLDVHLVGKIKKVIDNGSKVNIKAKYDGATIADIELDLCELAKDRKFKYQCPAQPADFDVHHTIKIPLGSPKGTYVFKAYGFNQDNVRIFNISTKRNTRDSY